MIKKTHWKSMILVKFINILLLSEEKYFNIKGYAGYAFML